MVFVETDTCDGCAEALTFEYDLFVKETGLTPKQLPTTGVPNDFVMIQKVGPPMEYKVAKWRDRSLAVERVTGEKIRIDHKMRFVVCKNALPGLTPKSKSGLKPIEYMWPVDFVDDGRSGGMDIEWYQNSILEYVYSAFGFEKEEPKGNTSLGLEAWM